MHVFFSAALPEVLITAFFGGTRHFAAIIRTTRFHGSIRGISLVQLWSGPFASLCGCTAAQRKACTQTFGIFCTVVLPIVAGPYRCSKTCVCRFSMKTNQRSRWDDALNLCLNMFNLKDVIYQYGLKLNILFDKNSYQWKIYLWMVWPNIKYKTFV